MQNHHTAPVRVHKRRFTILWSLLFVVAALLSTTTSALAQPQEAPDTPQVHAVNLARPAMVRIITSLSSSISVQFPLTSGSFSPSVHFPRDTASYQLRYSGSGSFISSHGDILTASHVVSPPHDKSLDDALYQTAAEDIANYINTTYNSGTAYTAEDAYYLLSIGNLHSTTHYGQPKSDAYLSTDYSGPPTATQIDQLDSWEHAPIDTVKAESSFDAHDVAIVHVELNDTPSIPIGNALDLAPQEELTILGFPGNADVSDKDVANTFLTPSINRVMVSALKTKDDGTPLIQVSGNIGHGDSGGPALNTAGQIVGVVSFGLADATATTFLQSSQSAQELIQQAQIDTTPGQFTNLWKEAYNAYAQHNWQQAHDKFQQLTQKYPNFKGDAPYEALALKAQQSSGAFSWLSQDQLMILIIVAAVVIVLVAIFVFIVMRRGKKKQQPTPLNTQQNNPFLPQDQQHQLNSGAPSNPFGQQPVSVQPVYTGSSSPSSPTYAGLSSSPQQQPVQQQNPWDSRPIPPQQPVYQPASSQTVQPTPPPVQTQLAQYNAQPQQNPFESNQQEQSPFEITPQQNSFAQSSPQNQSVSSPQQYSQPVPQQNPFAPPPQQYSQPVQQQNPFAPPPQQYSQPVQQQNPFAPPPQQYSQPVPQQNPFAPSPQQYSQPAPQQNQSASSPQQYSQPGQQAPQYTPAQNIPVPTPQQQPYSDQVFDEQPAPPTRQQANWEYSEATVMPPKATPFDQEDPDTTPTPPHTPAVQASHHSQQFHFEESPFDQEEDNPNLSTNEIEKMMINRPRHRIPPPPRHLGKDEEEPQ